MDTIKRIILKGGPDKKDYLDLNEAFKSLDLTNKLNQDEIKRLFFPILSLDSMQGHAYLKPYGYAGDFELIDKIYTSWVSGDPNLKKWDEFFHTQDGAKAVRNRKQYFIDLVTTLSNRQQVTVLNIGSGPARDIKEFFDLNINSNVYFDCIELDNNAIKHAEKLCTMYNDKITYFNKNIFRFKPNKKYDLIWSAGLFDYFTDKQFISLLKRLASFVCNDGKLVIGNFSTKHPSRPYMEKIGQWILNHRNKETLIRLAKEAGINKTNISVSQEKEGVNLFLHIKST